MAEVTWEPRGGGIQSDISPEKISGGGLFCTIPETGALNIRSVGAGTNLSPSYEPIQGDTFSNGFTEPVLQNVIFKVEISSAIGGFYQFRFKTANGTTIATTAAIAIVAGNLAATYTAITSGAGGITPTLVAATQTSIVGALVTTATDEGYFTVEITTIPGWDYEMFAVAGSLEFKTPLIQEGVDPSMLGFWNEIGSDSRVGDLWQLWTTRRTLPVVTPITGAVDNGAGLIRITAVGHGLLNNFSVEVQSVGGVPNANGIWIVNVIDADTVDLPGSTFAGAYTGGGTLTSYIYGYGQITVSVKDENSQTWTGYVLLRSKEFNFTTLQQIDCRTKRKQDSNIALYFTDDYNNYRVFYYKGVYLNDGGLVINGGKYEYGSIADEILLDVSTSGFDLTFVQQIQSGGNIRSGNTRYAARFGTSSGKVFTHWGFLTNPVPATIESESGSGYQFFGRPEGTATPKQNVLRITNPEPGIFDVVEIAAINYLDGGYTGEIIGRYVLTGAPTQDIVHTGFEIGVQNLDIGELNNVSLPILHGRNIELLNNRLVKSNLTLAPIPDLQEFFENMTFSIERAVLPGTTVGSFIGGNLTTGEYMLSQNVNRRCTLIANERYRSLFRVEFVSGGFSPLYWARDYIVNTDNTQPGCTGALPDLDLTTGAIGAQEAYYFFIRWGGYNVNQLINGVPFKKLVKRIYHYRCSVTNPQVLACGIIILAVSGFVGGGGAGVDNLSIGAGGVLAEFPFPGGVNEPTFLPSVPVDYFYGDTSAANNFVTERAYASFYSPDIFLGHTQIVPTAGDFIFNYGQPNRTWLAYPEGGAGNFDEDYIQESDGIANGVPDEVLIDSGTNIDKGGTALINGLLFSKEIDVNNVPSILSKFENPSGIVVHADAAGIGSFDVLTGAQDRAVYRAQYVRKIADGDTQYGAKADSKGEYTGTFLEINDNTPTTFDVTEGDCFVQLCWFKNRYPTDYFFAPNPVAVGFGQGLGFYSQNRANFQMRDPFAGSGSPAAFPASATPQAQTWLNNINLESLSYNEGYTIRNEIQSVETYDPLAEYQTDWRNAEMWSELEAEGAVTDRLRIFLPLNINFEDYNYGYISGFWNLNEEAVVVQQRRVKRAYFNSNAVFTTREGTEVITGDGEVMRQKGITVSKLASSHKWSIGTGKNTRGNDVLYGINTDTDLNIWRYGYDGQDNLSEMQLIASFCKNNFRFIIDKDNPAHEQGVCFFANQAKREVGWTFRGWKEGVQEWTEPVYELAHQFDSTDGNGPYGDLIEVNGIFYGTTSFGGAGNAGIIFSFDPSNGTFVNLFDFTFGSVAEGYSPSAGLVYVNSKLYGITPLGGANNFGTIFSINLDGTGFNNEFDIVLASGATGVGELIEFNGKLYGMTSAGGTSTFGVLFEYDYLTTTYTELFEFTGTAGAFPGAAPQGKLYTDGTFLYGLTRTGGANNFGVLFQFDLVTYTVLHNFTTLTGTFPVKAVTKSGSKLYGTTSSQGQFVGGVLFEFDLLTLTYTVLQDFPAGSEPFSTPTVVGNNIYGTTRFGGASNFGILWSYNIVTNLYSKIYDFNTPDIYPRGQMLLLNNILYGTTVGTTLVNYGTIFSYSLQGIYNIGDRVTLGTTSFEEIPAFYESLIDNNVFNEPPSLADPPAWALIPTTDNRYYSFFTLAYSELKDVFQLFMSPKPKVYWVFKDGYGSCRPVGNTGLNFEFDTGSNSPPEWFNDGNTSLIGEAFFDSVINVPPKNKKTFSALKYISDANPQRIEVFTKSQRTYMDEIDMERRENQTTVSIMNDSTVTTVGVNGSQPNPNGLNNIDTGKLWGKYAIVRTIMRTYNRIESFTMLLRTRSRMPEKQNMNNR